MNIRKRFAALTAAAALAVGMLPAAMAENAVMDDLTARVAGSIRHSISEQLGEDMNTYSNFGIASWTEAQPSHFDLRERGVVPAIRSQGSMGTCWGFASISASEISLLNSLKMTMEEYEAAYGEPLNLSEKHLAWFSTVPIPESEGETQAGEGRFMLNPDAASSDHYRTGGFMGYASGLFASGMGPLPERMVPYADSEGTDSMAGDWSLDESMRFLTMYELKDSSILPSPAQHDADGYYVYNPVATAMIKSELLKGRAVSICYTADQAMDPDYLLKYYTDWFIADGFDERMAELAARIETHMPLPEDATPEEIREAQRMCYAIEKQVLLEEVTDEILDSALAKIAEKEAAETDGEESADQAAQELAEAEATIYRVAEKFGADPELVAASIGFALDDTEDEETETQYFVNWETTAQYISNQSMGANHAVTIVGYDDDYAVSNFRADNPPPAPGAWIVRNSWGGNWGNEGYFYLSYYDKTICAPESFEFVTDLDAMSASELYIYQYDYMPATTIHSAVTKEPVYMANEFTVDTDSVLSYVSAMTANYNTNVTVAVYLLNENAASPIDGELLDVRTVNYDYAGYHRIALNQHYVLSAGTRISVVQTQRIDQEDGLYYALPYTYATNGAFAELWNELPFQVDFMDAKAAVNGVINHGESFVGAGDAWCDWADFVDGVKDADSIVREFTSFDNLSIKAYCYPLSDVSEIHVFGEAVPYAGGTVKLCTECGYALVER